MKDPEYCKIYGKGHLKDLYDEADYFINQKEETDQYIKFSKLELAELKDRCQDLWELKSELEDIQRNLSSEMLGYKVNSLLHFIYYLEDLISKKEEIK